jgi:metallo-beta-lactamase family protein
MSATMSFLGGAETVTGSRYLIQSRHGTLLVDCGLFQGYKPLRERNWAPFPVDPQEIDAVIITHAHLDHTGYLPALVRDGFRGRIHSTAGTAELSAIILPDSGRLLEEQAKYAARSHSSRHKVPRPLYTEENALAALTRFTTHPFDEEFDIAGARASFVPAGHILGAAQLKLEVDDTRLHFTGDLGRADDALMLPPRSLEATDILISESTYGDRVHPVGDAEAALADIIVRVCGRGGVVLLPAFAVGRAESLLLHLSRLRAAGRIPDVPVFLNSPMAVNAAETYARFPEEHRISAEEFHRMYEYATLVHSVEDSKSLNTRGGPAIIISASGMLEGGRVLHHVAAYGPDPRNAIVLTGFQAGGTRGEALQRGERTLRIYGRDIPILAEVHSLEMLSAHADAAQIVDWMRTAPLAPPQIFLTHGELTASDSLRTRIHRELGWEARIPRQGETIILPGARLSTGADEQLSTARGGSRQTMRAAVVSSFTTPISVEDVEIPAPAAGEVLVRIEASGLCHTDIHAAQGDWPVKPQLPFIPGHEGIGRVVEHGDGVATPPIGARVALAWLGAACGVCRYCLSGRENLCPAQRNTGYSVNGAHSEYAVVDARFAVPVPERISPTDAAALTCAGVTTYAAVKNAHVVPAERVAVFGIGGLGHLAVQYARLVGAEVIAVDVSNEKLALAKDLGADHVVNANEVDPVEAIRTLGGADAAIVLATAPPVFDQAYRSLARGGRLVLVSLPKGGTVTIPVFDTVLSGIEVIGSIVGTRVDLAEVFRLHALGRTRVVAEVRALSTIAASVQEVLEGTVPARIVFDLTADRVG